MHWLRIALCLVISVTIAAPCIAGPSMEVDPARPFGAINLRQWHLDQYLSGTQKESARLVFMQQLPRPQLEELGRRCAVIDSEPQRFGEDALAVCYSAQGALKMPKG
jgi:hypothetical protein